MQEGVGGGGVNCTVFHLSFLTHSACQYDVTYIVTGKSLRSLVQIAKGYDSYLDQRCREKAKKLANIAIYRLFDRTSVIFGVAIICLCKPF